MRKSKTNRIYRGISAILMAAALLWLTISPVYLFSEDTKGTIRNYSVNDNWNDDGMNSNPLNGSEEKAPDGDGSALSEYLHHPHESINAGAEQVTYKKAPSENTYIAFHGELLSPPPEL